MRRLLVGATALFCMGILAAGCNPTTETPPLDNQAAEAKKMPGANTPPAATMDASAAKKAKEGN